MKKDKSSGLVPGFSFSGVSAGIKISGNPDLALIYSDSLAVTAGVFTTNSIKAAPVKLAMESIQSGKGRAVLINSGNANACTGARGMKDARNIRTRAGRVLSMDAELVYVSSTGIIGVPLPVQKISNALPALVDGLSPAGISAAAAAIMTTDTYPKIVTKKFRIGSGYATLSGIAKGAGMICPDMATMLCFIMTDAAITRPALLTALKRAVDKSFNRISVDNDMSTNDTVIAMANGHRGNVPLSTRSPYFNNFSRALDSLTDELSRMIVRDGEGATKLIEIVVEGAVSEVEAVKASRAVANSMLVKTAMYGKDPNWGRIIAAIGYSGASLREEKISIDLNGIRLVSRGIGTGKALEANKALSESEIVLKINLGAGRCSAGFITSDLTEEYIRVNAHYST